MPEPARITTDVTTAQVPDCPRVRGTRKEHPARWGSSCISSQFCGPGRPSFSSLQHHQQRSIRFPTCVPSSNCCRHFRSGVDEQGYIHTPNPIAGPGTTHPVGRHLSTRRQGRWGNGSSCARIWAFLGPPVPKFMLGASALGAKRGDPAFVLVFLVVLRT